MPLVSRGCISSYECVGKYMCVQVSEEARKGVSGAGVRGSPEPPDMGVGNQTQILWKSRKHS